MPIKIRIDVKKITKSRLYEGAKGTYLDAILIETPNNERGNDYMIVESVSQEERKAGKKGPILGNGKKLGGGATARSGGAGSRRQNDPGDDLDGVPFSANFL